MAFKSDTEGAVSIKRSAVTVTEAYVNMCKKTSKGYTLIIGKREIEKMDLIYDYLDDIQGDIFSLDRKELEKKYFEICKHTVNKDIAQKIQQVDLNNYTASLIQKFQQILQHSAIKDLTAIYFEYDIDNNWEGTFFPCPDYISLSEEDDDWAADWIEVVDGPSLPPFSEIYDQYGGFEEDDEAGVTIYLIVRTILAFMASAQFVNTDVPVCIAYHDQDPIIRIKEDE
ncbi:hypothetical protein [Pseudobacillus badius]|uniref:hypothetical protein n=1 Tax=Bacillus badius TaxID=1455 RepID=UPI001CBE5147|nr:hypothetical protein [Bacillus badius]UAT29026.1 hypothetical protein K7T73_10340 [Bacillus badius]